MTTSEKTANFDQSEPVPLDPIILSARDELLEKYSDKSFEILNYLLQSCNRGRKR